MIYSEIIIPDLGLYSHLPKERVPIQQVGKNIYRVGLSSCENMTLSLKRGALSKVPGIANFTNAATGSTDSVRGISALGRYARPQNFESSNSQFLQVDASTDDAQSSGPSTFATNGNKLRVGNSGGTISDSISITATADDCYTNSSTLFNNLSYLWGGLDFDWGIRFQNVAIPNATVLSDARLYFYRGSWSSSITYGNLYGEDEDTSAAWTNRANFVGRTRTTASTSIGGTNSGNWIYFDVTAIVQEIIDRVGWVSGNDMTFIFDATSISDTGSLFSSNWLGLGARDPFLTYDGGTNVSYETGLRFDGITGLTKQVSKITSAKIKMRRDWKSTGTPNIRIYGEDTDTAATYSNRADWDGRTQTTAYVDWAPDTDEETGWIYSPELKDIVQEIIDRAAWDEATMAFMFTDNSSSADTLLAIRSYDYTGNADGAYLELHTDLEILTSPTYFMYVDGGTEGEVWKLDSNKDVSNVSQVAETYANAYRTQFGRFMQFGNDMLFTDDGKSDPQIWDSSTTPTVLIDLHTTAKGRYLNNFKRRTWLWYVVYGGTIYPSEGLYSAVGDATTFDTTNNTLPLSGSDAVTFAINRTEDIQVVFKEGSCYRIVDRQTAASDFQPILISDADGSLGANVVSDGNRLYGINEKGIFQYPVGGTHTGFRYIHVPIMDEFERITIDKMGLVYFEHWPKYKQIYINYPDEGSEYNSNCLVYNYELDQWESKTDIYASNVMYHCFNVAPSYSDIMLMGREDGHLKYVTGDDDAGNPFSCGFETGGLHLRNPDNASLIPRTLLEIEPVTNYNGSYTINFQVKGYDRPGDESTSSWSSVSTHKSDEAGTNKEIIEPELEKNEYLFHRIKVYNELADERIEIQALRLVWEIREDLVK
jgi:hypothetical protein